MFHVKHPPCNNSNQNHTRHRRQTQTQLSAAGYTPYEGFKTRGSIAQVYLRGTLAVDHGEMKTGPIGTYIPRHPGSL